MTKKLYEVTFGLIEDGNKDEILNYSAIKVIASDAKDAIKKTENHSSISTLKTFIESVELISLIDVE